MQQKTVLLFISVVITVFARGFAKGHGGHGSNPSGDDKRIPLCFEACTCRLGDDVYKIIKDCLETKLNKEEIDMEFKWMEENDFKDASQYRDDFDGLRGKFCVGEDDWKEGVINKIMMKNVDHMMVICNKKDQTICDRWSEMAMCIADEINKWDAQKKCERE